MHSFSCQFAWAQWFFVANISSQRTLTLLLLSMLIIIMHSKERKLRKRVFLVHYVSCFVIYFCQFIQFILTQIGLQRHHVVITHPFRISPYSHETLFFYYHYVIRCSNRLTPAVVAASTRRSPCEVVTPPRRFSWNASRGLTVAARLDNDAGGCERGPFLQRHWPVPVTPWTWWRWRRRP